VSHAVVRQRLFFFIFCRDSFVPAVILKPWPSLKRVCGEPFGFFSLTFPLNLSLSRSFRQEEQGVSPQPMIPSRRLTNFGGPRLFLLDAVSPNSDSFSGFETFDR